MNKKIILIAGLLFLLIASFVSGLIDIKVHKFNIVETSTEISSEEITKTLNLSGYDDTGKLMVKEVVLSYNLEDYTKCRNHYAIDYCKQKIKDNLEEQLKTRLNGEIDLMKTLNGKENYNEEVKEEDLTINYKAISDAVIADAGVIK